MSEGKWIIDGRDLYSEFGIAVLEGGLDELVAFPPLKSVKTNDWQEEDGIEADLENPLLDTRSVSIKMAAVRTSVEAGDFFDLLSNGVYHDFYARSLKRIFRLRYLSASKFELNNILNMTLKFSDDLPLQDYRYLPPMSAVFRTTDYSLDGKPLTDYGVRVLKGTLASIDKQPEAKQNLLRKSSIRNGIEYDGKRVTYKSKEVQVKCLMRAKTIEEFWRNHDALLYDLVRPDERRLGVEVRSKDFLFYYKSCKTDNFFTDDGIWWQFTLTLVFTSYRFRGRQEVLRLVSDGTLRITGNGCLRLIL